MGEKIAHIIPTHERPGVAQRLVNSISEHCPSHNIYICDDSKKPATYEGAIDIKSPAYDIGLSAKRNILVQESDEPYIFIWDDDYIATEDTEVEMHLELLNKLEDVGIVAGEWVLSGGSRRVWFTGDFWVTGPKQRHEPPQELYRIDSERYGAIRYHHVMYAPNWFLAKRSTLESIYWDEELKLQEHTEFFARLAAARYTQDTVAGRERDEIWYKRYKNRQFGNDETLVDENGRVQVYALGTFRNNAKLSHVGGMVKADTWVKVDKDYAEELQQKGLAYTRKEMTSARPFPVPDVNNDVDLGVAITPDSSCYHLRWDDTSKNEQFNANRDRDTFWPLQKEKLGTEQIEFEQWGRYPYKEIQHLQPSEVDFSLPNNYEHYG